MASFFRIIDLSNKSELIMKTIIELYESIKDDAKLFQVEMMVGQLQADIVYCNGDPELIRFRSKYTVRQWIGGKFENIQMINNCLRVAVLEARKNDLKLTQHGLGSNCTTCRFCVDANKFLSEGE